MSTDNDNILFGNGDELPSNRSGNPHIQDVINLGRRQVLAGGASLGALAFLGATLPGAVQAAGQSAERLKDFPLKRRSRLQFSAVPVTRHDGISVPPGYTATTFIPWGTPISGRYPAYLEDASNSAEDQAHQTGMHHDGMHFFPINAKYGGHQSDHGLLVVNHEYIDAPLLHPNGPTVVDGKCGFR